MSVKILGAVRDSVGESPFWDEQNRAIWSVDIVGKAIRKRSWPDGNTTTWQTTDLPTALALCKNGGAVVSFARDIRFWNEGKNAEILITQPETDPLLRLNEGKCDPRGRFWTTSMENNLTKDMTPRDQDVARGRLFRVDQQVATPLTGPEFGIPNTMAWSPDRKRFYFGDSGENTIWIWDYDDESGAIGNRRMFVSGGPGVPDGSCIDAEGYLWTARYGAGRVTRYDPDGKIEREIMLPVKNPTATTFAGYDLSMLIVTSAQFAMDNPGSDDGAMLVVQTDVQGQPENFYTGYINQRQDGSAG